MAPKKISEIAAEALVLRHAGAYGKLWEKVRRVSAAPAKLRSPVDVLDRVLLLRCEVDLLEAAQKLHHVKSSKPPRKKKA